MQSLERPVVLWFGPDASGDLKREFSNRGLLLEKVSDTAKDQDLVRARGAVYVFEKATLAQSIERFTKTYERAIDHGLLIYLLAESDAVQGSIGNVLARMNGSARFHRRTQPVEPHDIAELCARFSAGRPHTTSLDIDGLPAGHLSEEDRFLLCRAFGDCSAIRLTPLAGGRSATVFSVQATFRDSRAGPRPLPFFAKLDEREKVATEIQKYETYATYHIPFNLRPNLDVGRCIHGARRGILVGNFVEKSESLWDVARKGMGSRCIHALFEDTLRGWRSQAVQTEPISASVASALAHVVSPDRIQDEYVRFAGAQGMSMSSAEMWNVLLGLNQSYRLAPMHGDMHGENVRVRGSDAIVIDLLSTDRGPLASDLAGLETWLVFELPPEQLSDDARNRWVSLVDELYKPEAIDKLPKLESSDLSTSWIRDCVRQIRMIAATTQECSTEYQSAVAVYLMRRAMYPAANDADSYRRSYAYLTAARIVSYLKERSGK